MTPLYEVITRATVGAPKRDSATADSATAVIAAARQLLSEARAAGCGEPVCDMLVDGGIVLTGIRYRDLSRA